MRVAVYGISKNEAAHVEAWAASCADADARILLDTGSTDNTVELASSAGVTVFQERIVPWRFEQARNRSLELVPNDIDVCISLDLDEVLVAGWREELEQAFEAHITRYRYLYTWSWNDDGQPGLQYSGDKIHSRHGYAWRYPVHEVLVPTSDEIQGWTGVQIHHHRDQAKDRGQYLPLLELAVAEDPENDRNAHYLAREYMYEGRLAESAREFKRHLALPTALWDAERSQSLRYLATCEPERAEHWLRLSIAEAPSRREPWTDLAFLFQCEGRWEECLAACESALKLERRPQEYLTEAQAWGSRLDDMAANAAFRLHDFGAAVRHGERAVALEPADPRLHMNLARYRQEQAAWACARISSGNSISWRVLPTTSILSISPPPDLPTGWRLLNPSVATDGQSIRMIVRSVNYHLNHDRYAMVDDDGVIRSRTGIVEVNLDDEGGAEISNWRWVDDSAARSALPLYPVHGVEDMRLFHFEGQWWALGAIRDHSESGAIRQVLSRLVDDSESCRVEAPWRVPSPLTSDDNARAYEKNWVAIPDGAAGLDVIWSTEPFVRLRLDRLTRQVVATVGRPSRLVEHEWRGGSPVFATPHGSVYLTHRVGPLLSAEGRPSRTYLHRFVTLCQDHVHQGPPFAVEELALEFVAGACVVHDRLYLSYGRDDAEARLAICEWRDVMPLIPLACPAVT